MSLQITYKCGQCENWPTTVWIKDHGLHCPQCDARRALLSEPPKLEPCPVCETEHVYKQKDFNRKLGVALLAVGVVTSFFTYGISLLLVAAFDWWLYKHVGDVGLCYRCDSQFRGSAEVSKLPPFNLSYYDYYKNLKKP